MPTKNLRTIRLVRTEGDNGAEFLRPLAWLTPDDPAKSAAWE
jgi:hypothetical protein